MNKFINSLIPNPIKRKLYSHFKKQLILRRQEQSKLIPRYDLQEIHIAKTKLLNNRDKLLDNLPKNAIVAELGVARGKFSSKIIKLTTPKKLHLIDLWGSKAYPNFLKTLVYDKFKNEIDKELVEIHVGLSTELVNQFEDNYFDWIYIDTDHSYKGTKLELEFFSKKVKPEGIIAGHDFIIGNWDGNIRYGVMEAVCEFCVKNNWEIIYLTTELSTLPSYAIRRINS